MKRTIFAALAAIMIAGCGDGIEENSGVTADEAAALNEAEAMLDEPAETGELPVKDQ